MPVIFINGVSIANAGRYGLDSYYSPQQHLRDIADVQDVEYEEVESTKPKTRKNEITRTSMDRP